MKKFIDLYEKGDFFEETPFNCAMKALYAQALVCYRKSTGPWKLISDRDRIQLSVCHYAIGNVRFETDIEWQNEVMSLCKEAALRLQRSDAHFTAQECSRILTEPITKGAFDPEGLTLLFDHLADVATEKLSEMLPLAD